MSMMDPITMATQLATFDVQPFQQRYQLQADKYQSQLSALGKVETALREFRTVIDKMNSATASVIKNTATLSQEGNFTANVDASALNGSYQIFVEQVATAHQVSTGMPAGTTADTQIPTTGTLDFTLNGEAMSIDLSTVDTDGDGTATLTELAAAINNDSTNPGINATLVRANGETHFMLSSTDTGVANTINVSASGTGQAWFEDAFTNLTDISTPQDAKIWLGAQGSGLALTSSSNTFSDVITGVDITVTKAQAAGEQPVGLTIGADQEATKEQLNAFIDAYNNLVSTIDGLTGSGSEDQQRGVLASDPTVRSVESQLSNLLRTQYNGKSLMEVGLSINREGKLELDTERFEAAQANGSSSLEAMFNGDGNLFDSLDQAIDPFLKFSNGLFKTRKDALQQNISRIDDKQATLERKYQMSYDRYLAQFTQMNSLMTQMNQTGSLFA
ncbi:flagellar hook-associated protein [Photobacterium proteolyticum]|uniref:Flagellar hook-associated protein 2 n=1 Tax=Photobacterium proteolyticum TaxID=1903952 RepID=A0A1Q9GVG8_9GAMM|nr:flagellar filament capping protein FliD [Photobacterium proteolyticum]OLQ79139.1 flagellar hook-associated protein [Photobacterium proteolyticum]